MLNGTHTHFLEYKCFGVESTVMTEHTVKFKFK